LATSSFSRLRGLAPALRAGILIAACAAAALVVLSLPELPEWPGPRGLADRRTFLGIPNAFDVLSNLPFALAGILGLARARALERELRPAGLVLFASLLAVAFGSSFFHLDPSQSRLLVDRLPITVAFLSLFALVLGDRISPGLARTALAPLLAFGLGTALLWYLGGETPGRGDLRPYALVQAVPMVALPLLLVFYPGRLDERRLFVAFALYGTAKGCEALDHQLFALLGVASGHTLKHLAAGAACFFLAPERRARPPFVRQSQDPRCPT